MSNANLASLRDARQSLGPGVIASAVVAAAAFLAEYYQHPVMLLALLLGMAMGFLADGKVSFLAQCKVWAMRYPVSA